MTRQETTETTNHQPANADQAANPGAAQTSAEPSAAGAAPAAEKSQPSIEEQVAAAKAEAAAHYDRYLRAVADHENFRKRTAREKDELRQYAAARLLEDLMPVLDNLGLGLAAARQPNATVKSLVEGVEMVQTQLKQALAQHGLTEINPAGQAFDAHQHEALSHVPSPEVPEGNIINVIRVGYSLNGRLLRPASVVVSSGVPAAADKA
ncbi:MAG: nucleotide exchange factor GrpE [Opitutaceae bacterium]|nr:nucleotide exchange factor GrpE [Opitutaceae bacterium]